MSKHENQLFQEIYIYLETLVQWLERVTFNHFIRVRIS